MTQGILNFQYQAEPSTTGMTGLAGLPAYLELAVASGLIDSIRRHMRVCAEQTQGWTDDQIVMSLIMLNIAGGDCVDDLRILEKDEGFARVLRRAELHGLLRKERREQERRWQKERKRAVPSQPPVFRYLEAFSDPVEEAKRGVGYAFIPALNEHLQALSRVNEDLLRFAQRRSPQREATLEQDASLVETYKRDALFSYQGYKAYQPLTTRWAEQDMIVHSEFRDGNVPAGFGNLRVLQQTLAALPDGVVKVYYRSDTASYEHKLLTYCAEGKNERFGVIEFAVGVDVTLEFKRAVAKVEEKNWHPLEKESNGELVKACPEHSEGTEQEWAEVNFVPSWAGYKKDGPEYRFLAIRELLQQRELPGLDSPQLPFPTLDIGEVRYKLFGVVTNRDLPGDKVIHWSRARCGKGEEMHSVLKEDLAGGQLPSSRFGANAAWWAISVLSFNLNSLMKHLVLPQGWATKRLKAVRFGLIHLAGRVTTHARQLIIRLSANHPAYKLLLEVRQRIEDLWRHSEMVAASRSP
ncbi:MAG: IS1380 family transposase [Deltaproteobacteria bacterium]|nr:IS1380 family transposase [Deltaproteobacteria bacterium]